MDLCNQMVARRRGRPDWSRFYVCDKRQYFYCSIPKNACTSWILTVLRLTRKDLTGLGSVHVPRKTDKILKRAVHYSSGARTEMVKRYYKLMFVREPLERLVSAFRDKCLYDPDYRWLQRVIWNRRIKANSTRTGMTITSSCAHNPCTRLLFLSIVIAIPGPSERVSDWAVIKNEKCLFTGLWDLGRVIKFDVIVNLRKKTAIFVLFRLMNMYELKNENENVNEQINWWNIRPLSTPKKLNWSSSNCACVMKHGRNPACKFS